MLHCFLDISLCIPKKIAASMALLALDVDSFTLSGDKLTEIADKLAKLIVEWNCNRMYCLYKLQGKNLENEGNCQGMLLVQVITLSFRLCRYCIINIGVATKLFWCHDQLFE